MILSLQRIDRILFGKPVQEIAGVIHLQLLLKKALHKSQIGLCIRGKNRSRFLCAIRKKDLRLFALSDNMCSRCNGQRKLLIFRGVLSGVQYGTGTGNAACVKNHLISGQCLMQLVRLQGIHPVNGPVLQKEASNQKHRSNDGKYNRRHRLFILNLMIVDIHPILSYSRSTSVRHNNSQSKSARIRQTCSEIISIKKTI